MVDNFNAAASDFISVTESFNFLQHGSFHLVFPLVMTLSQKLILGS